jgi:hypothetical protein
MAGVTGTVVIHTIAVMVMGMATILADKTMVMATVVDTAEATVTVVDTAEATVTVVDTVEATVTQGEWVM